MAFVHFNGMSLAAFVNVWERTYTVKTESEDLVIGQIRSEKNTQWSLVDSTYSFLSPKVFVKKSGTLFKRSLKKTAAHITSHEWTRLNGAALQSNVSWIFWIEIKFACAVLSISSISRVTFIYMWSKGAHPCNIHVIGMISSTLVNIWETVNAFCTSFLSPNDLKLL